MSPVTGGNPSFSSGQMCYYLMEPEAPMNSINFNTNHLRFFGSAKLKALSGMATL